ncbi:terpene synthase family protein [Streptomyces sp. NPDC048357]|uniref:terpene synthase family protein n=1 Tax=Streptomyces sp. NPDC048357 TaxID=3154719 RepID=UPI003446FC6F
MDELLFLHLAEYVHGIELPGEARDLPALAQARAYASEWIGLYNDVFSAQKEEAVGYGFNVVLVIRDQRGCSQQEAIDWRA